MTRSTVVIELAGDAQFSRDLAVGGVFVPGCTLRLTDECDLVVRGANRQIVVAARVVYVDEHQGAGLELIGFSPEMQAQLADLEPVASPGIEVIEVPVLDESMDDGAAPDGPGRFDDELEHGEPSEQILLTDLQALDDALDDAPVYDFSLPEVADGGRAEPGAGATGAGADAVDAGTHDGDTIAILADPSLVNADTEPSVPETAEDPLARREPGSATRGVARNVHERLRGLTLPAQLKLATSGELHERIVLERLYGKNVWEALLSNPRLTPPEVSRIARYGALPRALLEIIVGNNAWLQVPEVRRALLSNPRLATDQIMKVLRLTPKHELKLASIQTAYPHAVRSAAKMMILRGD